MLAGNGRRPLHLGGGHLIDQDDPFTGPSFSLRNRALRALWSVVWHSAFRVSPRPMHAWRAMLLRAFGAQVGHHCHVYPGVQIWAPWNLKLGNYVGVGSGVTLYSMARIELGDYVVVSQGAHLCCGSHDYNSENFKLVARPILVRDRAWICAEAFLHPGVEVSEGSVIGARAVLVRAAKEPWTVYAGNPAVPVARRRRASKSSSMDDQSTE
jgi:putative colanic acid biosynthesis acetyltransferase WcaF